VHLNIDLYSCSGSERQGTHIDHHGAQRREPPARQVADRGHHSAQRVANTGWCRDFSASQIQMWSEWQEACSLSELQVRSEQHSSSAPPAQQHHEGDEEGDDDAFTAPDAALGDAELQCALSEMGSVLKLSCADPQVLKVARQALQEYFQRRPASLVRLAMISWRFAFSASVPDFRAAVAANATFHLRRIIRSDVNQCHCR